MLEELGLTDEVIYPYLLRGGVAAFASLVAVEDSPSIANLRRAGAIVIGRTNAPEFSWRWFTDNELYGETVYPWNRQRTCGGSSGGAAAAVECLVQMLFDNA
jgi:amidase